MTKKVYDREPDTLRYQFTKESGDEIKTPEFVMVETYKSQEALEKHLGATAFKDLGKTFGNEGLLAKDLAIFRVESVAGYERRKSNL